jgi:hypothetical protein
MSTELMDSLAASQSQARRLQAELVSERAKLARMQRSNEALAFELWQVRDMLTDADRDTDSARHYAATWKALAKQIRACRNLERWQYDQFIGDIANLRIEIYEHEDRWQRVVELGREMRSDVDGNPMRYSSAHWLDRFADILAEPTTEAEVAP